MKLHNYATILKMLYSDTRFYVGSGTRVMTTAGGDETISGVGFQPRLVIFIAADNASSGRSSIGFDNISGIACLVNYHLIGADRWIIDSSKSIFIAISSTVRYFSTIKSMTSDGFILTWGKAGSPTGTITYGFIAFR